MLSWIRRGKPREKRVVVLGLDCLEPSLAFGEYADAMPTLTRLCQEGGYGRLESVIPPITVPAWACMMTGKDPGTLGIYGFRNRTDYGYEKLSIVTSRDVRERTVWDRLTEDGKRSVVIGVPPGYPPKPLNGYAIGCFLTPNARTDYTYPPSLKGELEEQFGEYQFDVRDFRTDDKRWLLDQIYQLTEQRFRVAQHLLTTKPWDFFMVVDMGPDRLHHGFWKFCDPLHRKHEPDNPFRNAMREYYRFLDEQLQRFLEHVPDDAAVWIVSDHGAKRMDGGICINEWLLREGYLCVKRPPEGIQRFEELEVDWSRTVAWGEGGYYSRIFLNVRGREPQGIVAPSEYESVRDELTRKLEALGDERGNPIGTRVYKPEEIYERVNGIAPDLIAVLGDLHWRSVGTVGWGTVWVHENDTGPDDANHAQHGLYVARGVPDLRGERDLHLLEVHERLLRLLGGGT